jgi:probable H4MPT-linked C1 transfer pathway protein
MSPATVPATPPSDLLALDVGGAHVKAADGAGWTHAEPFALWREPQRLRDVLTRVARQRTPRRLVATMTGEIADCYASRAEGVARIVADVEAAAADCGAEPGIYLLDRELDGPPGCPVGGRIVPPPEAVARPLAAAASNWHALARLAATVAPTDRCLLVDVGSTTTDLVAIVARMPRPLAADDAGRMATGELVYTGIERTPVAAIVRSLPHAGSRRPISSERFADARDAWLLAGGLAEEPDSCDTADGRPATRAAARLRLARMLLVESAAFSSAAAALAARWIVTAQSRQVARACSRVSRSHGWQPTSVVLSGHGTALAQMALARLGWDVAIESLPDRLGPAVSRAGPAHALALIARGDVP